MIEISETGYWEDALRDNTGKGFRRTKNGRYETFISNHCRSINLGTYNTELEAMEALFEYRVDRLIGGIYKYGLRIDDGRVFMENYLAFPEGLIFNLHGELMRGAIDRNGYIHGMFNNININHHRIIASLFCQRRPGCDYINHIDGNKQNNRAENLEWVTRSENTSHAFRTGLQNNIAGVPIYSIEERDYMREHCYDHYRDVAKYLDRNPETVRKYLERYRRELSNDQNR